MKIAAVVDGVKYTYFQNMFSGDARLFVNSVELIKMSKRIFLNEVDGERKTYVVKSSLLVGVSLETEKEDKIVLSQNYWYDWLILALSLAGFLVGVFFGMVAGFLSALFCIVAALSNLVLIRHPMSLKLRISLNALIILVANALWVTISYTVVGILVLTAFAQPDFLFH